MRVGRPGAKGGCEGNFSETSTCPLPVPKTCQWDLGAGDELGL